MWCKTCFKSKPAAEFGYRAVHADGAAVALILRTECLECRAIRLRVKDSAPNNAWCRGQASASFGQPDRSDSAVGQPTSPYSKDGLTAPANQSKRNMHPSSSWLGMA